MDTKRIKVLRAEPESGGYRLTLECGYTFGPDAAWVQHTAWRKTPVAYVMHCNQCEYREEVLADYWSSV